jgi:hypothetical protein
LILYNHFFMFDNNVDMSELRFDAKWIELNVSI